MTGLDRAAIKAASLSKARTLTDPATLKVTLPDIQLRDVLELDLARTVSDVMTATVARGYPLRAGDSSDQSHQGAGPCGRTCHLRGLPQGAIQQHQPSRNVA
ncbi:hypothetical protein [Paracoccus sp. Ld10]|uniref:hypothetical protein n=1 Tax=Paracoccus sp. Ld10 TaxID=649158 RepID=UPI0038660A0A